jgi:beta-barrel assembly-enhancing protease
VKLENRLPAEGINASREHPFKEFAWLVGGALAVVAMLVVAISYGAQWIAPRIPFEYETRLVGDRLASAPKTQEGRAVQAQLQALADRLAAHMDLPRGMKVKAGYHEGAMVNAFATLGGHTVFFRGLLAKVDSEDALAMVMAHEIAHLKYRHPAAALGRGVAVGVVLSVVSADLGRSAAGGVLGQAGMLTLLSFNREQERQADAEALRVLAAEYGHVGGAIDLFDVFTRVQAEQASASIPVAEFLHTHPLTANRVQAVRQWANERGKALDGPRRPLSGAIAAARDAVRKQKAENATPELN